MGCPFCTKTTVPVWPARRRGRCSAGKGALSDLTIPQRDLVNPHTRPACLFSETGSERFIPVGPARRSTTGGSAHTGHTKIDIKDIRGTWESSVPSAIDSFRIELCIAFKRFLHSSFGAPPKNTDTHWGYSCCRLSTHTGHAAHMFREEGELLLGALRFGSEPVKGIVAPQNITTHELVSQSTSRSTH